MMHTTSPTRAGGSRRSSAVSTRTDRPSPAARTPYTTNAELGPLVQTYRRVRNRMNPKKLARLVELLAKIAGGVWDRYEHTESREDFVQDCCVLFLQSAIRKIDPDRNPFSYLTTCAINFGNKKRITSIRERRAEHVHREDHRGYIERISAEREERDQADDFDHEHEPE